MALALVEARRAPLLLSPLSFYFLWYAIGFGAAAVSIGTRLAESETIRFAGVPVTPEQLQSGYLLALLGSFALHLGIQMTRPLPIAGHGEPALWPSGVLPRGLLLFFIWCVGMLARAVALPSGVLGAAFGILVWGGCAALCTLALTGGAPQRRHGGTWIILVLGTIGELLVNIESGSKGFILYSFIPLFWLCACDRALRWWLVPGVIALAIAYLTIIAPVTLLARSEGQLGPDETRLGRFARLWWEREPDPSLTHSDKVQEFFERQYDPLAVAFIAQEVERFGLRNGETMDYLAYAMIPRFLWPDKPMVSRSAWFSTYLGLAESEASATTATGQTAIGELYWNFGTLGVAFGMLVIGILIGVAWRIAGAQPLTNPIRMLLYLNLVLGMPDMSEAGTVCIAMTYRILVFGALFAGARLFGSIRVGSRHPWPVGVRNNFSAAAKPVTH